MARSPVQFVHLRARSPYSMLEGALQIKDMVKRCEEWRMPALGLTDTNNMCGALEFSEALVGAGIQPIMGCTLSVDVGAADNPHTVSQEPDGTIVLLAQSERGYQNLMKLSSAAFLDVSATDLPHVKWDHLEAHADDVIALTGGLDGFINRLIVDGREALAREWLEKLAGLYDGRLYVELQRHMQAENAAAEARLLPWAYDLDLPLVATNEPYFLDPDMHEAHDALLAISEGSYVLEPNRRHVSPHHYFKSPEQMADLFSDLPEAIENTLEISRRCAYRSPKRAPILPGFGDENLSEVDILTAESKAGLEERLSQIELATSREAYFERLEFEIGIIAQMGFPGYFLIVSDFIKWAKAQGIPVGPGRGSGAGSVVAWALSITDLDPLRYGLLFERFLNPERVSMPDFDVDFCQERRGEVIRYVQDKYGADQVAHIITFGTLQARAVVRDVGRTLQMPLGQVDRLAKMVPSNPANPVTLAQAVGMEKDLREARDTDPKVRELLTKALQLEGLYRNASTHAAGVVIGDRPLTELVPLYRDPRSDIPATQFTMKWVEKAGLVKFDFLGLKTLTVIDRAVKYLAKQGIEVDIDAVPTTDPKAYTPLHDGLSAGVFQLESSGMRDVLRKMAPDSIEELTALISLYRPGPMKNIDTYIDRKFGRIPIEYELPELEPILKETYGIIIYQEQVMQIAQVLSGYSLGEADILRRAMGKKDKAEMARQKSRFVDGAKDRGHDPRVAGDIFELVNEFAGYGFNKSHAAAYAMISYRTAYLKANYPTEFMAAVMSLDITNVEKLAQYYPEAKRMGLTIVAPDVNVSFADFEVKDGKMLYALGALKNVGVDAMKHLVAVREEGGPFKDLFDFARRIDTRTVNKRAFENLARAGAFDSLEPNRAKALAAASTLQSIGQRASEERNSAQVGLFGDAPDVMAEPDLPDMPPWQNLEALDQELSAVGLYLSGHPLEGFMESLKAQRTLMAEDVPSAFSRGTRAAKMAGVLRKKQERLSKSGRSRYAYITLSDPTGEYEAFVKPEVLDRVRSNLTEGRVVSVQMQLEDRDGEVRLSANTIESLSGDITEAPPVKGLKVILRSDAALDGLKNRLESLSDAPAKAYGALHVVLPLVGGKEGEFVLTQRYSVDPAFRNALKSIRDVEDVVLMTA